MSTGIYRTASPILSDLLSGPIENLLASGGDERLRVDTTTRLNQYGCRSSPRPEAFAFASSTASSISTIGYQAADAARKELLACTLDDNPATSLALQMQKQREELSNLFGLDERGAQIVLSPSGTDSQLHALYLAKLTTRGPVTSVIAASDETGSGAGNAVVGNHFSSITARGVSTMKGQPISGLADGNAKVTVALRTEDGYLRSPQELDAEITREVSRAAASGSVVLLYVMDHSKLGSSCPSDECVREIARRWPDSVRIVVDACQFRLPRVRVESHLDDGFMVIVTGSKFFGGPPFSGALLVPRGFSNRIENAEYVPSGLRGYSSKSDWPAAWTGVRALLADEINVGQFLRWAAALAEIREYLAVPSHFRRFAIQKFAETAMDLISTYPMFELIDVLSQSTSRDSLEEFSSRTIFPFRIYKQGKPISIHHAKSAYRALNGDLSKYFHEPHAKSLSRDLCHVGQPVSVHVNREIVTGAIRLSCSASFVYESWSEQVRMTGSQKRMNATFEQLKKTLDKLQLIVSSDTLTFESEGQDD